MTSSTEARTIFENIDFTVVDLGHVGLNVEYVGRRRGEEVSETRRLEGRLADQVREMIGGMPRTKVPWLLAERLGIQRVWRPVCLVNLRWAREYPGGIIHVSREAMPDGSARYWLETRCCEGYLCGEYGEGKSFDIRSVREESSRIAAGRGPLASSSRELEYEI